MTFRGIRWVVAAFILLAASGIVDAQDIEVTSQVDRRQIAANEAVKLTLTITSARQLVHVPAPQIDLSAFEVYGPSVSTHMQIVNRRTSFSRDLEYTLYARKAGRHTIGAASLEIDGKTYQTEPIRIDVSSGRRKSGQGNKASGGGQGGGDDLSDNLFLRARLDPDTVYVNEQVTASFDLCYRYNLRDVGFSEIPTFSGFWTHELFVAQRLDPQVEEIGDRQFHVAPLRRMALFPARDGTLQIDAMAVTCAIPQRRQRRSAFDAFSLFDDPLFGRTQSVMVRSLQLPVVARPLPEADRPPAFSGLVGQIEIQASAEPRRVATGDPVTLRVQVVGIGNLHSMKAPVLRIDGLKIYEPKGEMQQTVSEDGRLGGAATYEYIVIPERSGGFTIPPIEVAYFDPTRRQYRLASTDQIALLSEGETVTNASAALHDMTRSEIAELGSDIRHIKPDVSELEAPREIDRQVWFWAVQLLLPMGYVALSLFRRHQERLLGDVGYARRRGASDAARRRLQEAAEALDSTEPIFFATLHTALVSFIGDQINEPTPGLDRVRCRSLLRAGGVVEPTLERLDQLLEICEEGRFSPGQTPQAKRRNVLARSEAVIDELREAI